MEPRRARLSVEDCNLTPLGAFMLAQQLNERLSWRIIAEVHLHSPGSFTLTFTPPNAYWKSPAMFKELAAWTSYITRGGIIFEETQESTEMFMIERKQ